MIRLLLVPVTFLALSFVGCGESVSEKRANEARDSNTRQEEAYVDKRLRSLEERVTALEGVGK